MLDSQFPFPGDQNELQYSAFKLRLMVTSFLEELPEEAAPAIRDALERASTPAPSTIAYFEEVQALILAVVDVAGRMNAGIPSHRKLQSAMTNFMQNFNGCAQVSRVIPTFDLA